MDIFLYVLAWLGILILAFLAVVIARTLAFKPKEVKQTAAEEEKVDRDKVISTLQTLVRFKTVSYRDHSLEDETEFEGMISALPTLFPNVYKECTLTKLNDRALLYRWRGKSDASPAVMMAHYDVVPVEENSFQNVTILSCHIPRYQNS